MKEKKVPLLICPWGHKARHFHSKITGLHLIWCPQCNKKGWVVQTRNYNTYNQAAKAWNKRA